jgi:hypothetical protein
MCEVCEHRWIDTIWCCILLDSDGACSRIVCSRFSCPCWCDLIGELPTSLLLLMQRSCFCPNMLVVGPGASSGMVLRDNSEHVCLVYENDAGIHAQYL